ncbi:lactate dehydrogenase [Sinomonas atrocyanea]|uniref:L-lactate dehydrogenase n=1 Tax=Sinomonas atrocyanea TaxID=37927 RepID=A0A127A4R3_9MICC|nr:L-lactate dehydrogenase [Sinomonas atrocyanea]AMM33891.1 lactate dehydrogenase [Sinomonas atrocyanea]GEB63488.1 L-lactate dehydrogenase [Sinomonas atrocyanea]GGG56621.1 L-lactate dehydrogenase [Sinomonas atrocyanea]
MAAQAGKLVVVGAGAVGSSVAYAALIRGSAREVVLYDIDQAKVEAEVLDLAHGTQFTGASSITGGTDLALAAGADIVVITAGAKQRPGQTRLELAGTNARILENLMPRLTEQAPEAVYVLVTNPCDVLTVIAQRISGLPAGRVFASGTVLDTSRLRWLLGERIGVSRSSVHAYIVGEHGDTEFPLWACATIGGVPLRDWRADDGSLAFTPESLEALAHNVRTAAYRVIEGKGATNYAIGLSAARIVEAVLGREDAVLPVSSVLSGQYGLHGVALSLPSVVGAGGVRRVLEVPMDDGELARLGRSAEALRASAQSLGY